MALRLRDGAYRKLEFIRMLEQHELIPQLLFIFFVRRVADNRPRNGANFLAGWGFVMANAFRAAVGIYLVD